MAEEVVSVRYLVDDVEAAIAWYTTHLGFSVLSSYPPAFADVKRGALRLLLSGPTSSAGRPMADGERPGPGGWNRIHLIVDDLAAEVARLKAEGVKFRNDIVTGPGGSQVLIVDPSGNLVELFQARDGERAAATGPVGCYSSRSRKSRVDGSRSFLSSPRSRLWTRID